MSHQAYLAVATVHIPLSLCSNSVHVSIFQMRTLRLREVKYPCVRSEAFLVEDLVIFYVVLSLKSNSLSLYHTARLSAVEPPEMS